MTTRNLFTAALAILGTITNVLSADPMVSNVTANQRPGTKLVDITYDVKADTPTVKVTIEISSDGGTTYSVPVTSATGAVGDGVAIGTGKTITWNAGVEWDGKFTQQARFRVIADDLQIAGFARVEGGALPELSYAGPQRVNTFYIAKTEVTWSEFETIRIWAVANGYQISRPFAFGPNCPVTEVPWYETLIWCNALSEKQGLRPVYRVGGAVYRSQFSVPTIDATANGYRLPSEKEWEFAARGGVKTKGYLYSGSNDIAAVAWNYPGLTVQTMEVATKQPNELGISDMSGNAWEWCFDAASSTTDPNRVIRGGSTYEAASSCRVSARSSTRPSTWSRSIGFRIARNSPP
jgi:long-subunit fatty acid transport protein